MTKWKVIRISEYNYDRIIKDAKFGDTIDDALTNLIDRLNRVTSKHGG